MITTTLVKQIVVLSGDSEKRNLILSNQEHSYITDDLKEQTIITFVVVCSDFIT